MLWKINLHIFGKTFFSKNNILFIYFYRGEGRENERETNISTWLPLERPLLEAWPATQPWALTGNQTGDSGSQFSAQSTEPYHPVLVKYFYVNLFYMIAIDLNKYTQLGFFLWADYWEVEQSDFNFSLGA